jgi:N-methylhydantoinase B/oxoprolinase/acetone carboxylase alpha subunit
LLLPGGGGYGDPRRRTRALIEADLRNGSITPEAARRDYGEEI